MVPTLGKIITMGVSHLLVLIIADSTPKSIILIIADFGKSNTVLPFCGLIFKGKGRHSGRFLAACSGLRPHFEYCGPVSCLECLSRS